MSDDKHDKHFSMFSQTGNRRVDKALDAAARAYAPNEYAAVLDRELRKVAQDHPEVQDTAVREVVAKHVHSTCYARMWDFTQVQNESAYLAW